MAAYKDLVGQKITKVTSNPSEPKTGQMWYNSTTGFLKGLGVVSAWVSGTPLINGRKAAGSAGTQTAGLWFGGSTGPDDTVINKTEEFNGSGWSETTNMNTSRGMMPGGAGTQTSALAFGGVSGPPNVSTANSEAWDGSSWSEGPDLGQARNKMAGFGTQTAALGCGGYNNSPEATFALTEEYNGSTWSEQTDMSTARRYLMGFGTQTAGLVCGGFDPSISSATEEYDGTSWTTGGSLNNATGSAGSAGANNTAGLVFGGQDPSGNLTRMEGYDGTTWSAKPAMGSARKLTTGTGTKIAAVCAGGQNPPSTQNLQTTEEYTQSTNTITAAAWASGGNMNSGRTGSAGFANKDDLVIAGGFISTPSPASDDSQNLVEEYNGSTWTAVTAMPSKRTSASGCGASQTSGMVSGGIHANQTTSVEYDGTNWTSGGDVPAVSRMAAHCGTVPAALRCGGAGNPGPALDQTIEYDGSSWTTGNTMPHAEYGHMLVGTQTAAVFSGGHNAPTRDNLYEYDGTNWTTSPATLAVSINNNAGAAANGTQTAAMWMGGQPAVTVSQVYDGTSVFTQPSLGAGRYNANNGGGGTSTAAILGGGSGDTDATEEFTGATVSANIGNFSAS